MYRRLKRFTIVYTHLRNSNHVCYVERISSAKKDATLNNILAAEVIRSSVLLTGSEALFVFCTATIRVRLDHWSHRRVPLLWKELLASTVR